MRPDYLKNKIFLDGSDLTETHSVLETLGFLDGQTTNPSNFAKAPDIAKRVEAGEKFDKDEVYDAYKSRIQELSKILPNGSISIEVYADAQTSADQMFSQGKEMFGWINNAHIKYPTTAAGLEAASRSIAEGMRVNMTLVFTQQQAAAVYAATKGAKRGDVFVSPFIGRLVDRKENGFNLISNVIKMYQEKGDGHVEVLTSSVRTADQFAHALALGTDIITAYFAAVDEWGKGGMKVPDVNDFDYGDLQPIAYEDIELNQNWNAFNIKHDLTDNGLERFVNDWNAIIE